jgi:hypothetical protein
VTVAAEWEVTRKRKRRRKYIEEESARERKRVEITRWKSLYQDKDVARSVCIVLRSGGEKGACEERRI